MLSHEHWYQYLVLDPYDQARMDLPGTAAMLDITFESEAAGGIATSDLAIVAESAFQFTKTTDAGPLFVLVRMLKSAIPFRARFQPASVFFLIATLFSEMMDCWQYRAIYAFDPNELIGIEEGSSLEMLFEQAWDTAEYGMNKYGKSETLIEVAIKYSFSRGNFPNIYKNIIAGIAEHLHNRDDGPFLLPQCRLATELDIPQSTINAIIQSLRREGVLKVVKEAVHLQGKAQQYSFHWPKELNEKPRKPK